MYSILQRQIKLLRLSYGRSPFEEWLNSSKLHPYQSIVDARLTRLRNGNFGDFKSVGEGVYELRIYVGPGIRIYYALLTSNIFILLYGGTKSTQKKDIQKAQRLWRTFQNEN